MPAEHRPTPARAKRPCGHDLAGFYRSSSEPGVYRCLLCSQPIQPPPEPPEPEERHLRSVK